MMELTQLGNLFKCNKCGSCTSVCPLYQQTVYEGMAARGELALLLGRARSAADARNRRFRYDLDLLGGKLASLNPTAVLTRGYAIALDRATGKAVRSVSETRTGQALDLRVSDGVFGAVVEKKKT